MPYKFHGQPVHSYKPSASRRPSKLETIFESPPKTRSKPRSPARIPRVQNLGWNYGPSNLLALLTYNPHAPRTLARVGGNVPALAVARDRANLQRIINNARAKYQNAKTNANRIAIYKQFAKNHKAALNSLKLKHIKMLEELNAVIQNSQMTPGNKLTKSLQGAVNALKASLKKH
jgi:hypothetical protein